MFHCFPSKLTWSSDGITDVVTFFQIFDQRLLKKFVVAESKDIYRSSDSPYKLLQFPQNEKGKNQKRVWQINEVMGSE